jgi:hypothetical protein
VLARPFAVEPGGAGDGDLRALDGQHALGAIGRLAVVVGGLSLGGLQAEAVLAVEDERSLGGHLEGIGEAVAVRGDPQRVELVRPVARRGHLPVVDPGAEGVEFHPGLADAAAGEELGVEMRVLGGEAGVAHPDLLAGPAVALRPGFGRLPEERPLHAVVAALGILQRRGQVPPFDAVLGMRAVVGGEFEPGGRRDLGEALGGGSEAGVALGQPRGREEGKISAP